VGLFAGLLVHLTRALGVGAVQPMIDRETGGGELIWPQWLAMNASIALFITALAANGSRGGQAWAVPVFYFAVALLVLPIASRLALPNISRKERIANLLIAGIGLFLLRIIREPIIFTGFDEYLHWVSARRLIETQNIFSPNVLFPIGPFYPGLEIVTTALANLSGLDIFVSATIVLLIARIIFVGALFLFYERLTGSSRVAALGCIFFMGSPTFVFFQTAFAYESLAVSLMVVCLLLDLRICEAATRLSNRMLMFVIAVFALSMTHHVTSYGLAGLLLGMLAVEAIRRGPKDRALARLFATVFFACLMPVLWSWAMGNPASGYLGPEVQAGVQGMREFVSSGLRSERQLFTSDDGTVAPLWQRDLALGSVAIISAGLALGFFRSLSWGGLFAQRNFGFGAFFEWNNTRLVFLTLLTLLYPVIMLCHLTRGAWELGFRMSPYAFVGVGLVLAICTVSLIQKHSKNKFRAVAIGATSTVIVLGGIISSDPIVLPAARYRVSADAASIEPMGISAALWTKTWLGGENRFTADRVNNVLLAGFGEQLISTMQQFRLDAGVSIVSATLGPYQLSILRRLGIDYLLVDLRLTTNLPLFGIYYNEGEADQMLSGRTPEPAALLKFTSTPGVSRIFDNGYEEIYDVSALSGRN
jgi:hypothetical protein